LFDLVDKNFIPLGIIVKNSIDVLNNSKKTMVLLHELALSHSAKLRLRQPQGQTSSRHSVASATPA